MPCSDSFVKIYSGSTVESSVMSTYCNSAQTTPIAIDFSGYFLVHIRTNGLITNFNLTMGYVERGTNPLELCISQCDKTLDKPLFSASAYPTSGSEVKSVGYSSYRYSSADYQWLIVGPPGKRIKFTLHNLVVSSETEKNDQTICRINAIQPMQYNRVGNTHPKQGTSWKDLLATVTVVAVQKSLQYLGCPFRHTHKLTIKKCIKNIWYLQNLFPSKKNCFLK